MEVDGMGLLEDHVLLETGGFPFPCDVFVGGYLNWRVT